MASKIVALSITSGGMVQFLKTLRHRNNVLVKTRSRPLSASQQLEELTAIDRAAKAVKAAKLVKEAEAKAAKAAKLVKDKATYLSRFEGPLRDLAEAGWDAKMAKAAERSEAKAADRKTKCKLTKSGKPRLTGPQRKARHLLDSCRKLDKIPLSKAAIKACVRLLGHLPAGKKTTVLQQIDAFIRGLIETNAGITGVMQWPRFVSGSVIGKLALTVIIGTEVTYAESRRQITACIQAILLVAYNQATLLGTVVTRSVLDEAARTCMTGSNQAEIMQGYFAAHGCPMCGSHRYGLVTTNGSISFRRGAAQVAELQASQERLSTCACICVLTQAVIDDRAAKSDKAAVEA